MAGRHRRSVAGDVLFWLVVLLFGGTIVFIILTAAGVLTRG